MKAVLMYETMAQVNGAGCGDHVWQEAQGKPPHDPIRRCTRCGMELLTERDIKRGGGERLGWMIAKLNAPDFEEQAE